MVDGVHDCHNLRFVPMNTGTPTFLMANPPAQKAEVRFELTFWIDAQAKIFLSARDARTKEQVKETLSWQP